MPNLNDFAGKANTRSGKSPAHVRYIRNGKKLTLMALICFCFLCFMPHSSKTNTVPPIQSTQIAIAPADLVQNTIYFFADHGNGMSVAKYDRTEGDNIYTFADIKPLLLSFSGAGLWGTVSDAGSIRVATLTETISLLLSIIAGVFVPYP